MSLTNSCRFIGRLGHEPELEYTPSGMARLKLRIAIKERKRIDEEWETVSSWIRLLAFGNNAENITEYVGKGDLVAFETHFEERVWEDEEGETRRFYDFVIERWDIQQRSPRNRDDYYDDYIDEDEEEEETPTLNF